MILILSAFLIHFVLAEDLQSSTPTAEDYIKKVVQEEVSKSCPTCQVEVEILNPKVIEDIAVPDKVITERWKGQTNLVLKLGIDTRIITVSIRWKDQVVIANKNIRQGEIINESDLRVVEKDVTYLQAAYVQNPKDIVGLKGQMVFKRGQVIDETKLKKPLAVLYGQPIKLILEEGSLSLMMTGHAKGAGAIGDRIPVIIPETRKTISAVVIDKNTARVE